MTLHSFLVFCQWPAFITGILGALLVSGTSNRKRYWGFFIWIISDVAFFLYGSSVDAWGLMGIQIFYVANCLKGMYNNRKEDDATH